MTGSTTSNKDASSDRPTTKRVDAAAATSRPLPASSMRFVVGRDPAASLFEVVLPVKVDAFSYAAIALSLVEVPVATTRWAAAY